MLGMGLLSTVSAQTCTKETVTGQYGLICSVVGVNIPVAMVANVNIGQNRGVPATVTGAGKVNFSGVVQNMTLSGTTAVNGDCTGTVSLATGSTLVPTLTLAYHVVDGGNEIRGISTDPPGLVFTCSLRLITR
jgi:hypothetical protein